MVLYVKAVSAVNATLFTDSIIVLKPHEVSVGCKGRFVELIVMLAPQLGFRFSVEINF